MRPPDARAIALINVQGNLTPAGAYFFQRRAQAPPDRGFDPEQRASLVANKEVIKLKDGSNAVLRSWNGRKWVFTKLGTEYYSK